MLQIVEGELGTLPLLAVEGAPGHVIGGITFRVGEADEMLCEHGITRLVAHMVATNLSDETHRLGVDAQLTTTSFIAEGSGADVAALLAGVTSMLTSLPVSRLETERRVLLAEAEKRRRDVRMALLAERWGACAYGMPWHDEFALRTSDADLLREWCAEHFHRDTAVAWLAGDPDGIAVCRAAADLSLPAGPPPPSIEANPIVATPAWRGAGGSLFGISFNHETGNEAAFAGQQLLGRRLHRLLRTERGQITGFNGSTDRLLGDELNVAMWTECLEGHSDSVTATVHTELGRLASGDATAHELDEIRVLWTKAATEAVAAPGLALSSAQLRVLGQPLRTREEVAERFASVTPADVAAAVGAMVGTGLWLLPEGASPPSGLAEPQAADAPRWTGGRERAHLAADTDRAHRLVVNDEGVSYVWSPQQAINITWSEVVAVQCFDDSRVVWGRDGSRIFIHPDEWTDGAVALSTVDVHTAPRLRVEMGKTAGSAYLAHIDSSQPATGPTGAESRAAGPPPTQPVAPTKRRLFRRN